MANGKSLADKLRGWIVAAFGEIAQAFADFFHAPIKLGMELMMDVVSEEMGVGIDNFLDKKIGEGKIPASAKQEFKDLTGEFGGEGGALIGFVVYMVIGPFIAAGLEPMAQGMRNESWGAFRMKRLISNELIAAAFKDPKFQHLIAEDLGDQGFTEERIEAITEAYRKTLVEGDIRDLFLRGLLEDRTEDDLLNKLGYNDADKADLKKLFWTVPPVPDMVRFADFSAFDPDVIARWKEYFDCPSWLVEPFKKVGISDEEPDRWASRYWFSHFRQPGRFELGDLHHRQLISDDDAKLAYKTMGYSQFWQDNLLELVKEIPTRVDVRRFLEMGTIDEARLREIYHSLGYYDKDLDDYVLWTKVYCAMPDLLARWKNGWITIEEVRAELLACGMKEPHIQNLIETKIQNASPERVEEERGLTKAEIYAGVKKGVITWGEGEELLMDLGYGEDEANFILAVRVGVAEGSPKSFLEFKWWTLWYKGMQGKAVNLPPFDVILAEKAYKEAKAAHSILVAEKGPENEILKAAEVLRVAEYSYGQLLVKWKESSSTGQTAATA